MDHSEPTGKILFEIDDKVDIDIKSEVDEN